MAVVAVINITDLICLFGDCSDLKKVFSTYLL